MRRALIALGAAMATLLAVAPASASGGRAPAAPAAPALSPSAMLLKAAGFKPLHPEAYAEAKARANAKAPRAPGSATPAGTNAPNPFVSFQGVDMLNPLINLAPSDSTGAVGPSRYVEIINQKVGLYDRSGNLIQSRTLAQFTGLSEGSFTLFDVQMIWDPGTEHFYFAMDAPNNAFTNDKLAWGFSKDDSPDTATPTDWCTYTSDFGGVYGTASFPDYPKLGDSRDFLLIGVNRFNIQLTQYLGSDVAWVTKPPAGPITTCPSISSFTLGVKKALKNADGSPTSTPIPANQTDTSGTGWVVGTQDVTEFPSSNYISVFKVTKKDTGGAKIGPASTVPLPMSYSLPPAAPQAGTTSTVDTLDGRLTQGVSSLDPAHKDPVTNKAMTAIWTQQTVDASGGGTGSEVRWYEIDPKNKVLFQSGIAQSPSLYVYNGAISSDRVVNGSTKKYGRSMGLGFNTSSGSQSIAIQMVSKVGNGAQSGFVMIKQSPGKNVDFTCFSPFGPPCRWGDYAGASPDPAAPTGMGSGQVWFTSQWNVTSTDNTNIDWTTWNWGARL